MKIEHSFKAGDKVTCNGFDTKVIKVCDGALLNMIEVKCPGGLVCVGVSELLMQNPQFKV